MWPLLFQHANVGLHTYTLLISLAYFVGLGVWIEEGRRFGISTEKIVNLSLGTFFVGLLGAKILFILTQLPLYLSGQYSLWSLSSGGIVFLGGLVSSALF